MLEELYIDGYRHFKDCRIPLKPATLICGRNGTGKTSIVDIMAALRDFIWGRDHAGQPVTARDLCSWEDFNHWEDIDLKIILGLKYRDENHGLFHYEIVISKAWHRDKGDVIELSRESLSLEEVKLYLAENGQSCVFENGKKKREYPVEQDISGLHMAGRFSKIIREFQHSIRRISSLSLNPHVRFSMHEHTDSTLAKDGYNFSAWYEETFLNRFPEAIGPLFAEYKNFIAGFRRLSFSDYRRYAKLYVDLNDGEEREYSLSFDQLSHGQKVLCVLYACIHAAPRNSTLMVDEFENHLSPSELQPLIDALQTAYEQKNLQFICISHHPKTLNWYHDSALIFSLEGAPARVKIIEHNPAQFAGALEERIMENGD